MMVFFGTPSQLDRKTRTPPGFDSVGGLVPIKPAAVVLPKVYSLCIASVCQLAKDT
jgi:hypothetical protein